MISELKNYKFEIEMKRTYLIISLLLVLCFQEMSAQTKKWTLEDCINYAVTNNIAIQRQRLQTESAEVNFLTSEMNLLPNLNAGSQGDVRFGRSVNPQTNIITFNQNLINSYYLTSNIQLFNGFAKVNTVSANKYMVMAGMESEKIVRNTLIIDIMGQFYQVLYSRGLENASKMQLDLSEKQQFRIVKMVETGKEALSRQYEIESQLSADRLAYTVARNNASQALTTLKQMLQLTNGADFDILMPDLNNLLIIDNTFNTDSIYSIAAQTLPRLKEIEFELKASKKQIAAARGNLVPSLSLSGTLSTGYIRTSSADTTSPFTSQLKLNRGEEVILTLNIPIFNNYSTGRNIKLAKIKRNDTSLKLEQEKNNLYTEVENACLNYNRGKDEFAAAKANYDFNTKSFSAVEKKFESGLVDVTEYSVAKTTLFKAETEALRTKLQLLIRKLTIQFYSTGEYQNLMN
jgi:outer membrane protein